MKTFLSRAAALGAVALALLMFPGTARAGGYDLNECCRQKLVWTSCRVDTPHDNRQICLTDICRLGDRDDCNRYDVCKPQPVWLNGDKCVGVKVCDVGKGCISLTATCEKGRDCYEKTCCMKMCDFQDYCKKMCCPCPPPPPCHGGQVPEPTSLLLLGLGGLGVGRTLRRKLLGKS